MAKFGTMEGQCGNGRMGNSATCVVDDRDTSHQQTVASGVRGGIGR